MGGGGLNASSVTIIVQVIEKHSVHILQNNAILFSREVAEKNPIIYSLNTYKSREIKIFGLEFHKFKWETRLKILALWA